MTFQTDTLQAERPEPWLRQCVFEDHGQLSAVEEIRLFAQRSTAIPVLLDILEDRTLLSSEAPGGGCAPIHAAELLATLGATEAIPAVLALLADPAYRDLYDITVARALWELGPAILEPALHAYAGNQDLRYRLQLAIVITALELRDERIFDLLVEMLAQEPEHGAMCLKRYGDPRAIAHLRRVLDGHAAACGALTFDEVIALGDAIEQLGGVLTPAQARAYRRALREEALVHEQVSALVTALTSDRAGADRSSRTARAHEQAAGRKRRNLRKRRKASRKRNRR